MNPSGLCKCGCGGKTKISSDANATKGWVKGQPKDFLKGHHMRLPVYFEQAKDALRKGQDLMLKRRKRTQKLGPYKAGRTQLAKKVADGVERAMKGGDHA